MRITHSKNAASAKSYFELSDYLDAEPNQSLKGRWFGRAAAMLGLHGEVEKKHFDRLVDNQMPFTDERLTARYREDRRVGTDLTFSTPKSVSLLWATTQDNAILEAVQEAANDTLADLEQDAQTRVNHSRGVMSLQKTGNIVGASWLHTTSRPVDGWPDPSLHVHCFVINATNTGDRWTAVDLSDVVRDSGLYEAMFQSRLAENMTQLGYPVARSARDFEIEGVSRETINKFSRRTAVIEEAAQENGITNAKEKGTLGAKTRDKKSTSVIPTAELPQKWRSEMTSSEAAIFDQLAQSRSAAPQGSPSATKAVDLAIEHCFEREAVIRERALLRQSILNGIGSASVEQIQDEMSQRDWIRQGNDNHALISTREVLKEEQSLLSFARQGRGRVRPLSIDHQIDRKFLSDEQQHAIRSLLSSKDRLQILRGVAGSGKTTMMHEAIEAIEKAGKPVTVLAPTAEAAHGVLAEQEGFKAETLARFLADESSHADAKDGVIWIDEAALVGTKDMAAIARIAEQQNSRVILSGDARQHQPLSRGLPFYLLESQAGIAPLEVSTIRRQSGSYKQAVELLSQGDVAAGIERLDELGRVEEIAADQERNRRLASDYADSIQDKQSSLVVAPSHAEREAITEAIRDELKSRGVVSGDERKITTLRSKRLTQAQRSDPASYAPGDVVEFVTKGKGGFKAGDRLKIAEVGKDSVIASCQKGRVELPLHSPKSFDVYQEKQQSFAAGDVIRITKNKRAGKSPGEKRLNNGSLATLKGFTDAGDLELSNGQTITAKWGHVDHGVTITSYGSQGKTYDRVFVAQSSLSFPASSPEQAYVSASRGRKSVTIYTDDKQALMQAVSHHRLARNASDLVETATDSEFAEKSKLHQRATQIGLRASQFAAKQIERFQKWMLSHSQKPQYAR